MRRWVLSGVGLGLGLVALVSPPVSRARACSPRAYDLGPAILRSSNGVFPDPPQIAHAYEHVVSYQDDPGGCGDVEYGCGFGAWVFEVQTSTATRLQVVVDGASVIVPRDEHLPRFVVGMGELPVRAPFEARVRFADAQGNASPPSTVQVTEVRVDTRPL